MARASRSRFALAFLALLLVGASSATLASSRETATSSRAGRSCLGRKATIVSGAATILGTKAPDSIVVLGGGRHAVEGLGGNDRICGGAGEDTIDGGRGVDRVAGGPGEDRISGDKGPDRLAGGPGDDVIDGAQGSDSLSGGGGGDTLGGDKGNERISGGPGDDTIDGGPGDDDLIEGGPGADSVTGGTGTDRVSGGAGDDVVRGDAGPDVLSGGPGAHDIVSYASATRRGVSVDLAAHRGKGDGHDSLQGFEDVVGSPQGDTIVGDSGPNRIDGGVGDDTLVGGGGGDEAFGGLGSDGCAGFEVESSCGPEPTPPADAAFTALDEGLDGSSLIVEGSPGPDQLRISWSAGSWTVSDGGRIFAGEGCARPAGGDTTLTCSGGPAVGLLVVTGGGGDDTIAVDPDVPANVTVRANGNGGSDVVEGGPGDDVLEAGENYKGPDDGNDVLIGNGGTDVLFADPGADQLRGGPGDDLLVSSVASCQGHSFDGGSGVDTVSYSRSRVGVRVDVAGTGGSAGCGSPDRLLADESLEGSDGPDVLIGDDGDNSLLGHLGADVLIGKGGKDFLDAADGQRDKRIDCGPGEDEVVRDRIDPAPIGC